MGMVERSSKQHGLGQTCLMLICSSTKIPVAHMPAGLKPCAAARSGFCARLLDHSGSLTICSQDCTPAAMPSTDVPAATLRELPRRPKACAPLSPPSGWPGAVSGQGDVLRRMAGANSGRSWGQDIRRARASSAQLASHAPRKCMVTGSILVRGMRSHSLWLLLVISDCLLGSAKACVRRADLL